MAIVVPTVSGGVDFVQFSQLLKEVPESYLACEYGKGETVVQAGVIKYVCRIGNVATIKSLSEVCRTCYTCPNFE